MAAYLGSSGSVELRRASENSSLAGTINPGDVNAGRRRFSFDFDSAALITGDKVEIATVDGAPLAFVDPSGWSDGALHPDGKWFVSVDDAGGIRLYRSFEDALNGQLSTAVQLQDITTALAVRVHTKNVIYRCLAQLTDYSITTSRETVDTTSLGEEFRDRYTAGLISGQGELTCIWDYRWAACDPAAKDGGSYPEAPNYLAQLVLQLQQGADFDGRFYLHTGADQLLWYEASCIVTNVAMAFGSNDVVRSQVQFVTTGPVKLRMGIPPTHLLLENRGLLLQESGAAIDLEEPL